MIGVERSGNRPIESPLDSIARTMRTCSSSQLWYNLCLVPLIDSVCLCVNLSSVGCCCCSVSIVDCPLLIYFCFLFLVYYYFFIFLKSQFKNANRSCFPPYDFMCVCSNNKPHLRSLTNPPETQQSIYKYFWFFRFLFMFLFFGFAFVFHCLTLLCPLPIKAP